MLWFHYLTLCLVDVYLPSIQPGLVPASLHRLPSGTRFPITKNTLFLPVFSTIWGKSFMLPPVPAWVFFTLTRESPSAKPRKLQGDHSTAEVECLLKSCTLSHSLPKKSNIVKTSLTPALVCSSLPPVFASIGWQTFKRRSPYPSSCSS